MIKKNIKFVIAAIFILLTCVSNLFAQIVTEPIFPFQNGAVTIILDTKNTALNNYTGELYAHTGVRLQGSDTWSYVIGEWGNNDTQPQLRYEGDGIYKLEISPDINTFYNLPFSADVHELAFVFRTSDGTSQTADMFVRVYDESLNVAIHTPLDQSVVQAGTSVEIVTSSINARSMTLYIDDNEVAATTESELSYSYTPELGSHSIKVIATDGLEHVEVVHRLLARDTITVQEIPETWREGINYPNDSAVGLVLYAPYKDFVYVIGDFNDWTPNNDFLMKKAPEGDLWWLEVNGLTPGLEYGFQYYIDAELKIADPYSTQISDPWNDSEIPERNYPNMYEYPEGKTTEIVTVVQTKQDAYQWEVENFDAPNQENLVIYELLVRDFTDERTFNSLIDTLDYIANLGVNAVELMPVNEFEGNISWGYNPSFYFAVDKFYGTKNDFKRLVDECHKRGIAVILDMVLNHSFGSSPMVRMYFEGGKPSALNPWYNREHNFLNPDAHWGYDFNHESEATRKFVDSVNNYWLSVYKVDGFRFDFTKGFTNEIKDNNDPWGSNYDASRVAILKRMADMIWKNHPHAYVTFEHLAENSEEKELADYGIMLWGNMNHNFNEGTMGWVNDGKSDIRGISYQHKNWNEPHLIAYAESHDEERLMYKNLQYGNSNVAVYDLKSEGNALKRMELAAVFLLSVPGPKLIWQFGEFGYDVSINFNGRTGIKPTKWDYLSDWRREYLHDVYASMINLAVNNPIFDAEDYYFDAYGPLKRLKLNAGEDGKAIVIGNWGLTTAAIDPQFYSTGTWYEYFTGEALEVTDINAKITLAPGEYRIYFDSAVDSPDIPVFKTERTGFSDIKIYPNPNNGNFIIELPGMDDANTTIETKLYTINGQLAAQHSYPASEQKQKVRFTKQQVPGIYFMELKSKNLNHLKKVIVK